jgi:hypothetical protein
LGTNKFGAKQIITEDCLKFDSKAEHRRWCELKLLERAGRITDLQRQVTYELIPKQDGERATKYVADFVYCDAAGNTIVEDTKGYKKGAAYDLFVIKRKLMLWVHGIQVKEV